ncbi:DUF3304 domain-containing protein [Pseudomonas sp. CCI4.2]|uniref:DUF3304 domain-containing protein n=3 Tax=unclassified Pseudomonas TaxID=196821 RepID=UPI002AC8E7A7|nr:DUF3304 domain-containing protein [Pseudomonas sp. CCI4.2]MEB0094442.1 DUF3304 domain-containing protein [Pseudomonas sp. CCI4.2]WPX55193.1 DUF3304 domain-containing protein [Pseudomonas sp. CCI4.2]
MSSFLNPGLVRRVPVFLAAAALACIALQACSKAPPDRLGIPIEGYNHTSAAINHFDVNGNGGPNIGPFGGGGSQMCCVSMPRKWYPGLTVVVEWEKDPNVGASQYWTESFSSNAWRVRMKEHRSKYTRHRAVVEVAPYERLGAITLHFLPCDQVKVSADQTYPGIANHPYDYPRKMEEPSVCPAS